NHKISSLLDDTVALGCNPKDTAGWILTDCAGILRKDGKTFNDLAVTAEKLAAIIKMVDSGDINRNIGKKILIAVVESDVDPVQYCKENGFDKKVDASAIESVIDAVIASNPQAIADYKAGKTKALMALFGSCMKELKGAADPAVIKELLENKVKNM
ncbi:MAG: Asp-tRNA(Asn)/Glu-tRNA(Gln) amidotransferase subunit GatB, partial [Clostridia bacterium]|nr:Asp-tRNA(Asn)/Glu-tRNA(Gln) amidotransferase subunit GatB [Clostridia bacterium]